MWKKSKFRLRIDKISDNHGHPRDPPFNIFSRVIHFIAEILVSLGSMVLVRSRRPLFFTARIKSYQARGGPHRRRISGFIGRSHGRIVDPPPLVYLAFLWLASRWSPSHPVPRDFLFPSYGRVVPGVGTLLFFFFFSCQKGGLRYSRPIILAAGAAIMALAGILFFREPASGRAHRNCSRNNRSSAFCAARQALVFQGTSAFSSELTSGNPPTKSPPFTACANLGRTLYPNNGKT